MALYLIVLLLVIFCFNGVIKWTKKERRYLLPKGPIGVPYFGNLFQIGKDPHLKFSEWAEKYGPIYTVFMARKPALVLSDVKLMKEMFSQSVSTGKFKNDTMLLLSRGPYGIVNSEGDVWAEQRNFCVRSLVKVGFGNKNLEPLMLSECKDLIQTIKEKTNELGVDNNKGLEINYFLKCATNNTLMTLVTGERLNLEDKGVSEISNEFTKRLQLSMRTGLGFFPWLKHIAPVASGYVGLDEISKAMHEFIQSYFDKNSGKNIPGSPRHLIDAYLDKIQTTDESSSFYGDIGRTNSISSVMELLQAGGETTAGTLIWLIFYMAVNPSVQKKVQEELDSVLGKQGRDPCLQDKCRLPYVEAVILETMRKSPIVPFGIIHELMEDFEFHGYRLPKGMLLIANAYHSHHDKKLWKDPENFRPERFLEYEDKENKLREFVVPFQIGKRKCLGEPLAKDVMFLFAAKLLHEFEISPSSVATLQGNVEEYYFDADTGLGLVPKPKMIVMKSRSSNIS